MDIGSESTNLGRVNNRADSLIEWSAWTTTPDSTSRWPGRKCFLHKTTVQEMTINTPCRASGRMLWFLVKQKQTEWKNRFSELPFSFSRLDNNWDYITNVVIMYFIGLALIAAAVISSSINHTLHQLYNESREQFVYNALSLFLDLIKRRWNHSMKGRIKRMRVYLRSCSAASTQRWEMGDRCWDNH